MFKCRNCGLKYEDSMVSAHNHTICVWCADEAEDHEVTSAYEDEE